MLNKYSSDTNYYTLIFPCVKEKTAQRFGFIRRFFALFAEMLPAIHPGFALMLVMICCVLFARRQPLSALLELQTRPNAVICANQYIAFGCVNELKASGIRIPEDMAVITFDDFPFSKIIEPQLSVVNLDMYDMGEQAAKVVLRRIRTPQYLVQSQTTLPILIERQSTKKLP